MKIRTDFVSNSSSSSFILKDAGFFALFGVTAEDVDEAIADLYGGKERVEKELADAVSDCEIGIVKAAAGGPDAAEDEDYYRKRLAELRRNGLGLWQVYDMIDKASARKCRRKWDDHLSGWFAPNEGEYGDWENIVSVLRSHCGIYNTLAALNGRDRDLEEDRYVKKTDKWTKRRFAGSGRFIRFVKESMGVKTMKEVLHDPACTMMIHFADNVVWSLDGMAAESKKYASEPYSPERFFEILIRRLAENGKVDLSDPRLLEYWKVAADDDFYRRKYPDRKYYLDGGKATWKDVYDDMLGVNAVMHEG